jgi:MraZ protein
MSLSNFRGGGSYNVDEKGRVTLPHKFRSASGGDRFVITRGFEKCLYLLTEDNWKNLEAALVERPFFDSETMQMQRFFYGDASDAVTDQQGRIVISPELRAYAFIEPNSEVRIVGCSRWIEIWNKKTYEDYTSTEFQKDFGPVAQRVWKREQTNTFTGDAE